MAEDGAPYAAEEETEEEEPQVDRAAHTASLPANDQLKARVPAPITRRAEQLYEQLTSRTRAARKGDLIAALIQAAPEDPDALRGLVKAYEDAQVWQTLIGETRKTGLVKLPPKKGQGRRPG
jgi:hypothetical protein